MGTLPVPSVLKGPVRPLSYQQEPIVLHKIFETTVSALAMINESNNNQIKAIHSIDIKESEAQQTALITTAGDTMSFAELNETANKLGRAILQSLAKSKRGRNSDGDFLIAVCINPSEALVATLLAIWKIGAAYLPLDPTFPKNRIEHILRESQPAMTIVGEDIWKKFPVVKYSELKAAGMGLSGQNIQEEETLTEEISQLELLAVVLYTSGSTGMPKGVRIKHTAILNRLKWQWKTFPYSTTEKVCVFKTALTFVDSVCELWGPLLNARTILILTKDDVKNPETLINLLEQHEVERLVLVPSLLRSILLFVGREKNKDVLPKLRLWVCSGEVLSVSLAREFYDVFDSKEHVLCNFYGSTEIMGDVTYHVIESPEELDKEEKVPIGKPIDNCTVYILNSTLHPVNVNEVGELYVSGWNLASGYVKGRDSFKFSHNSLTVDPGHHKLYSTGDFARMVKNVIYYEGRSDSQIKVRGHRVDLSEIETALAKIREVDKHVVLAYKPGEANQGILAFVTIKKKTTAREIEEQLAMLLAPYMLPQVIIVDHFPLLVNGKVDRQYLLSRYSGENSVKLPAIDYTGIPQEKMERAKILFETVAVVLGRSLRASINASSNFYSLGGNSLNSVFTVTKLKDLGFVISVGDFISSPTLMTVIDRMEKDCLIKGHGASFSSIVNYRTEMLMEGHKTAVYDIITNSFFEKADLEKHLVPPVKLSDYVEFMDAVWSHLLAADLSFVVLDEEGNTKGAVLNFDAHDEPEITLKPSNRLNVVFDFLEFLEGPIRSKKLPAGKNKVLHNFMMGVRTNLASPEIIEIFFYMELEVLNLARSKNFVGVLTSNTNELTQQLGCDVNNYEPLLNYQVNKYVAPDGSKPFGRAPDTQRTIVSWKTVSENGKK